MALVSLQKNGFKFFSYFDVSWWNGSVNDQSNKSSILAQKLHPRRLSAPALEAVYMYKFEKKNLYKLELESVFWNLQLMIKGLKASCDAWNWPHGGYLPLPVGYRHAKNDDKFYLKSDFSERYNLR